MNREGLPKTNDASKSENQPSTNEKMSIISIKQRKYSYYKNLNGDFKKDNFDYKKFEKREKIKDFLLLMPFRIIIFLAVFMCFIFFFMIFLYESGIVRGF